MLRRGLTALREAATAAKSKKRQTYLLTIHEGESKLLRFFGDFENDEAPYLADAHFMQGWADGEKSQFCGNNDPEHEGCEYCIRIARKDKRVGYASTKAYYDVKDYTKTHKYDNPVRVLKASYVHRPGKQPQPTDYEETQYPLCTAPKTPCVHCKNGNEAREGGIRAFALATSHATVLDATYADLLSYCMCGAKGSDGEGTIYVETYTCGQCGAGVEFDPSHGHPDAWCDACQAHFPPQEAISCTACGDQAQRARMTDWRFRIKRVGDKKATTYIPEAVHPPTAPTEEELEAYEKYKTNFEELTKPEPAAAQAARLGVAPANGQPQHGARAYGQQGGPQQIRDVGRDVAVQAERRAAAQQQARPAAVPGNRPVPQRPAPAQAAAPAKKPFSFSATKPTVAAPAVAAKPAAGKKPFTFRKPLAPAEEYATEVDYE